MKRSQDPFDVLVLGNHPASYLAALVTQSKERLRVGHVTIPDEILKEWRKIGAQGARHREAWEKRLSPVTESTRIFFASTSGSISLMFSGVMSTWPPSTERIASPPLLKDTNLNLAPVSRSMR